MAGQFALQNLQVNLTLSNYIYTRNLHPLSLPLSTLSHHQSMANTEPNHDKRNDGVCTFMLLTNANNNTTKSMRSLILPVFLRSVAMLATISAALVMGLNKQTKSTAVAIVGTTTLYQTLTAKLTDTPAFL